MYVQIFADMTATPLPHGQFMYTHKPTGFKCIIGRVPAAEKEMDGDVDMMYKPISFGLAEGVLQEEFGGYFSAEFEFSSIERSGILSNLVSALAKVVLP